MEHANPAAVILLAVFVIPVLWFIFAASKGLAIQIRRIPGIDAIDDAVGRAVELGRPISFTTGIASLGPLVYACLNVLRYIGQKVATYRAKLLVPSNDPEVMIVCDTTLQNAYRAAGRYSSYDPASVRFLPTEQFAYAAGYMGMIHRENVASAFLFGSFAAESLILAEAGQQVGAVQVAATASKEQIPFFIASCDYTLIGEELFAAGAYLTEDPVQRGSLRGQDFGKLVIILLVLLGVIHATINSALGLEDWIAVEAFLGMGWNEFIGGGA